MRIGILSSAHVHTHAYAHNLSTLPQVEVIGLADEDETRGRAFAGQYGLNLFPTYPSLLETRPDGVIVCSENAHHRHLVELAAQAGVHVLCEKPLATTLSDAQAMIDACQAAGVILMTAFPMRFSAPIVEVKRLLDQDGLGRVLAANTTNQGQVAKKYGDWFVDKELAGGGSVMDHTVHLADLLRWLLNTEVVEVYAQTNRIIQADQVEVETGGLVMITLANGTFATIDCSWSRPASYPAWGGLAMDLIGQKGVVTVDAFRQNLMAYQDGSTHPVWLPWGSDADRAMITGFLAAIESGGPPPVTGLDGYKALEVAMAVYRSAKLGQPVRLPLELA